MTTTLAAPVTPSEEPRPTRALSPSVPARVLIGVITFYRIAISPMRPPACRYTPTCSEYALDAVRIHGGAKGSWLGLRRLLRCHPWGGCGDDPVL